MNKHADGAESSHCGSYGGVEGSGGAPSDPFKHEASNRDAATRSLQQRQSQQREMRLRRLLKQAQPAAILDLLRY